MDSTIFDAIKSADWQVKAAVAAVTVVVSVLASDRISQLWLSWRLRKYPIINPEWGSNAQGAFFVNGEDLLRKGVEMVRAILVQLNFFPFFFS